MQSPVVFGTRTGRTTVGRTLHQAANSSKQHLQSIYVSLTSSGLQIQHVSTVGLQHCWQLDLADVNSDGESPSAGGDVRRRVCASLTIGAFTSRLFDIRSQMRSTRRSKTIVTLTSSFADDSKNSRPAIYYSSNLQLFLTCSKVFR